MAAPRSASALVRLLCACALVIAAGAGTALGCGGSVDGTSPSDAGDAELEGDVPSDAPEDVDGEAASDAEDAQADAPIEDVRSEFVDPGCPDAEPPPPAYECDPYADPSECGLGEACYPFVTHPFGAGCGFQQFGAVCLEAGTRGSGETCGDSAGRCAAGLICVIGSQPGKRCAELCPLDGSAACPAGLVCVETDAEGFGVCA